MYRLICIRIFDTNRGTAAKQLNPTGLTEIASDGGAQVLSHSRRGMLRRVDGPRPQADVPRRGRAPRRPGAVPGPGRRSARLQQDHPRRVRRPGVHGARARGQGGVVRR